MTEKSGVIVNVDGVSKSFKLPHEQSSGIKQHIINFLKHRRGYEIQHVLKDISFDIKTGEFFGIVGRNGSGKSTLLKILANIYEIDKGRVDVNGSLTPFIELGVGFNPELTGRENVFLNGALLGFSRKEMLSMYDSIVEFAELGKFMDQKLKNYSSGMQVRLAFSIAIRAQSDILLIDEVLAVGDTTFQQKCFDYFDQVKRENKTIIFVSHDMEAVKKYCDRAIYISKGEIIKVGKPADIAKIYNKDNNEQISKSAHKTDTNALLKIETRDTKGNKKNLFAYNDTMKIHFSWNTNDMSDTVHTVGAAIFKGNEHVYGLNTIGLRDTFDGKAQLDVQLNLGPGKYKIVAGLFGKNSSEVRTFNSDGPEFVVNADEHSSWEGITNLEAQWDK